MNLAAGPAGRAGALGQTGQAVEAERDRGAPCPAENASEGGGAVGSGAVVARRVGVRFLVRLAQSPPSQPRRWQNFSQLPPGVGGGTRRWTKKAPPRKTWRLPFLGSCLLHSRRQIPAVPLRLGAGPLPSKPRVSTADSAARRPPRPTTPAQAHGPTVHAHTHANLQTTNNPHTDS